MCLGISFWGSNEEEEEESREVWEEIGASPKNHRVPKSREGC